MAHWNGGFSRSLSHRGRAADRPTACMPQPRFRSTHWPGVIRLAAAGAAPQLWSPDSPSLYTVMTTLIIDGRAVHSAAKHCGFRTVEARAGRITLNGEPIYLRGMLDQAYYPETIYTPPSLELLEAQARTAKALGFNCLRTHIKVEDPRYYDVADRLGLLIWTEIPNCALLTDASIERSRQTIRGIVARDGHHPSIIAWTLINENWGTDLTRNPAHRRWLADFYHEVKALDPTRLVVDNSACCDNAHVAGDLEDFHHYRVIPDHARQWDEWVAGFAGRPGWSWYSDFAHERRADSPLLVSEFGNWGLPDPAAIREGGKEPWWFETGFDWGSGIVYPHGVEQRFEACGLADLFPSYAEFARHSQAHMARSLHYEISSMRLHDAIAGYVVTEFTDVHWECNGLLTMQRQPKHLLDPLLKDVNQDRVVLLRPAQWSGRPGQALEILVQTVGIAGRDTRGMIRWQAGDRSGELAAPGGTISVVLDSIPEGGMVTLNAAWLAEDGSQLAANQVDLACVAAEPTSVPLCVIDDAPLAAVLRSLGYRVRLGQAGAGAAGEIVVACRYTAALQAHVQKGGRVLLLADSGNRTRIRRERARGPPAGGAHCASRRHALGGRLGQLLCLDQETGSPGAPARRAAAGDGVGALDAECGDRRAAVLGSAQPQLGRAGRGLGAPGCVPAPGHALRPRTPADDDLPAQCDHAGRRSRGAGALRRRSEPAVRAL